MRALGLYVHIPFCLRKCSYCSFVSFPGMEALFDSYIEAVLAEAGLYRDLLKTRTVDTVFFGGGTPSLLDASQISRLVFGLASVCDWQPKELTLEANPETLTANMLKSYKQFGVNRISIGLQTHDDTVLKHIGRQHSFEVFEKAYHYVSRFFDNINVDIIFGLPGQSVGSHLETVRRVAALAPQHVSAYALKIEPGTPLAQTFDGADEDTDRAMCHATADILEAAGYAHYETSNFAKPGYACKHNLKYWTGEEYLGLGVAAHSCVENGKTIRFGNTEDIEAYIHATKSGKRPVESETILGEKDKQAEYLMLRLRLADGIDFGDYRESFGGDFLRTFDEAIEIVQKAGLVDIDAMGLRPTKKGFDLQNALIGQFIKKL